MWNLSLVGLQDFVALRGLLAMRIHCITASEATCSARASARLVWTAVTETIQKVDADPVPLNLLTVCMPEATPSYSAEHRRLVAEIDDFVAVVVVIPHDSTAIPAIRDWLRCDSLNS